MLGLPELKGLRPWMPLIPVVGAPVRHCPAGIDGALLA